MENEPRWPLWLAVIVMGGLLAFMYSVKIGSLT